MAVQIVVVEDSVADLLLFRKALERVDFDFHLLHFEDGESALQALFPGDGIPAVEPALIVLDLNLPRTEGLDLLRRIREAPRLSQVPVAILTSSEAPLDRQNSTRIGANRYILKPTEMHDFFDAIGSAVRDLLPDRIGNGGPAGTAK